MFYCSFKLGLSNQISSRTIAFEVWQFLEILLNVFARIGQQTKTCLENICGIQLSVCCRFVTFVEFPKLAEFYCGYDCLKAHLRYKWLPDLPLTFNKTKAILSVCVFGQIMIHLSMRRGTFLRFISNRCEGWFQSVSCERKAALWWGGQLCFGVLLFV